MVKRPDWIPAGAKAFRDPEFGWIVGYDTPEEFNAACEAHAAADPGNDLDIDPEDE